jgi:hypothetical protein
MARPASGASLSIAQLERALRDKRSEVGKLLKQRANVLKKLNAIDRKIERAGGSIVGGMGGGGGGGGGGGRVRNAQSLNDTIEAVLKSAGKALSVGDILDGVHRSGYRSNSANFRGIINQTLIKDKRFGQVQRGVYDLKSRGGKK